jgi:transposase-like protein
MAKKRNKYTEEFKRDAVRLMRNRGGAPLRWSPDDLGVPTNQLHRWASKLEARELAKRIDRGETLEQENQG